MAIQEDKRKERHSPRVINSSSEGGNDLNSTQNQSSKASLETYPNRVRENITGDAKIPDRESTPDWDIKNKQQDVLNEYPEEVDLSNQVEDKQQLDEKEEKIKFPDSVRFGDPASGSPGTGSYRISDCPPDAEKK